MLNRNVMAGWRGAWLAAALLLFALPAAAQTTTGTIQGTVRSATGTPIGDVEVRARNTGAGYERSATTRADGSYTLPGLAAATWEVSYRKVGFAPAARRAVIQVGATLVVDLTMEERAVEIEEATVVADAPSVETRTSEVATNVSQQQINDLPTANRNIFDLTALAPGVINSGDQVGSTRRQFISGAQNAAQVNVFIDGTSYKNDILPGGVVGQDRSRGNPFPRGAIQEFRVITQNYKAEYQKASGGIVTATTKSGTNQWEGSTFFNFQGQGIVALDSFQRFAKKNDPTFRKPTYERYLFGLSGGGPLIKDKLHVFASYEGNIQNRTSRVEITPPSGYPNLDTFNLTGLNGNFDTPFREHMFFGKLTYAVNPSSSLEFSADYRRNSDDRDFGALFNQPTTSAQRTNALDVNTATARVKYNIFRGNWLNESQISFQRYRDQMDRAHDDGLSFFFCCNFIATTGPGVTTQDFKQRRIGLRNDLTYTGFQFAGSHTLKTGVNVDFVKYDIFKRNSERPTWVFTDADSFTTPENVNFQLGDPTYGDNNMQLGLYVQDDWSPTPRLTINAGIRWDYESNMINANYRTPSDVRDSLTKYQDSLFRPLNPGRYFADGNDRSQFKGAFQPRLGASYQLDSRGRTTIFGGWGIFYDRTVFDLVQQEREALQNPRYQINFRRFPGDSTDPNKVPFDPAYFGFTPQELIDAVGPAAGTREVKLIPNDLKPPKAQQFSVGLRQLVGNWALQAQYNGIRSKNVPTFYWANFDFPCGNGTCGVNRPVPGFGTILQLEANGRTWYNAFTFQVDRSYRRSATSDIGWGVGLAYTFAKRETRGFNDDFSFPNEEFYPKQVRNDERHRVVTNWIVDVPYAFGVQFSGVITLGTGTKADVGDRFSDGSNPGNVPEFGGFEPPTHSFIIPGWAYRNVDMRLRKDFPSFSGTQLGVTFDVFNVFNYNNFGCWNTGNREDPNFGNPGCTIGDSRKAQVGVEYNF
jgi:hypothetical protein